MTLPGFDSSDRDRTSGGFPSPLAQPSVAPTTSIAIAPVSPAPLAAPVTPRSGRSAPVWIFGVLVLLLIALVGYFLAFLGTRARIAPIAEAPVPRKARK